MFDILVCYDISATAAQRLNNVGELHSGCPVFRRKLSKGLPDSVKPDEVMLVQRFHWNNNLEVTLTPGLSGSRRTVGIEGDWAVDFLDPNGDVVMTLRRDNFKD